MWVGVLVLNAQPRQHRARTALALTLLRLLYKALPSSRFPFLACATSMYARFLLPLLAQCALGILVSASNQVFISYESTTEGAGAQYQRILSLLGVARVHNLTYVHRVVSIGHIENGDDAWASKWDSMFDVLKNGFGVAFTEIASLPQTSPVVLRTKDDVANLKRGTVNIISHALPLTDSDPDLYYGSIVHDFRYPFKSQNSGRKLVFNKSKCNAALHLRVANADDDHDQYRGGILPGGHRYIKAEFYLELADFIQTKRLDCHVHIFTEPSITAKVVRKAIAHKSFVSLHEDFDAMDVFYHFVNADILFIAKSSFSYLAGLLNANVVMLTPFWHPPLSTWITLNPDLPVSFSKQELPGTSALSMFGVEPTLISMRSLCLKPFSYNGFTLPSLGLDAQGFLLVPSKFKRIIIDIGLSWNAPNSEVWLSKSSGELLVFGFDPNPKGNVELLSMQRQSKCQQGAICLNLERLADTFYLFPVALGDKHAVQPLYVSDSDPGTTSLYRPDNSNSGIRSSVQYDVPVFRLEDFLSLIPWKDSGRGSVEFVEHVKIDAQGNDFKILVGMGRFLTERVACVSVEPQAPGYFGVQQGSHSDFLESLSFKIIHASESVITAINEKFKHLPLKCSVLDN